MRITYKVRLFPTKAQRVRLEQTLDACRWLYNKTLETRKNAWENEQKTVGRYDTINLILQWKAEKPKLLAVHSQVLQEVCTRVDLAFKAFFRRVKTGETEAGYPRFRGRGWYDSFTYPESGFSMLDPGPGTPRVRLSKIGDLKIVLHRPLVGIVKTLTIRRDRVGNWYACFSCEVDATPLSPSHKVVGIDLMRRREDCPSTLDAAGRQRHCAVAAQERGVCQGQR